jgi:hypothetical protein
LKGNEVSNAETINGLTQAQNEFMRATLSAMLDRVGGDEVIAMLAEVMDDYAHTIARREGAYGRAAALGVMVKHLEGLDTFIENYDPTS